jgi:hypothetical protein
VGTGGNLTLSAASFAQFVQPPVAFPDLGQPGFPGQLQIPNIIGLSESYHVPAQLLVLAVKRLYHGTCIPEVSLQSSAACHPHQHQTIALMGARVGLRCLCR